MTGNADEIRRKMAEVRCEIGGNVDDLMEGARSLVDWRDYVKKYPLVCIGLACGLGYVLIPGRSRLHQPDPEQIARLMDLKKSALADQPELKQNNRWASSVLVGLAGAVVRTAATYAGQTALAALRDKLPDQSGQSSGNTTSNTVRRSAGPV